LLFGSQLFLNTLLLFFFNTLIFRLVFASLFTAKKAIPKISNGITIPRLAKNITFGVSF
jgi:hypothetical protein